MDTRALREANPWWAGGRLPARYRDTVPRAALPQLEAALDPRRAVVMPGPRRVGKTVLLHQLVGRLLSEGVRPERVVYLPADDPLFAPHEGLIREVTDFHRETVGPGAPLAYLESLAGQLPSSRYPDLTYVLVDEAHAIPDWPSWVKSYIDRGESYVWVVTSSAGVVVHRGSTESLAGRASTLRVFPFSQSEAAAHAGSPATEALRRASEVWESLGIGPVTGERAEALQTLYRDPTLPREEAVEASRAFLRTGGFPEFLGLDEGQRTRYFQESVVERVLLVDVPAIAEIRNPALMGRLLRHLLSQGPSIINISTIASELETTKVTLAEYLRVIEGTMLDYVLDRYAPREAMRHPGMKKSVPVDPGLVVALGGWDLDGVQGPANQGILAEVVVHTWLRRYAEGTAMAGGFAGGIPGGISHWRHRDKEVDFVASAPKWTLPIEVKWREERETRALSGMDEFRRRYPESEPLVITRDTFDLGSARAENSKGGGDSTRIGDSSGAGHPAPVRIPLWMLG